MLLIPHNCRPPEVRRIAGTSGGRQLYATYFVFLPVSPGCCKAAGIFFARSGRHLPQVTRSRPGATQRPPYAALRRRRRTNRPHVAKPHRIFEGRAAAAFCLPSSPPKVAAAAPGGKMHFFDTKSLQEKRKTKQESGQR